MTDEIKRVAEEIVKDCCRQYSILENATYLKHKIEQDIKEVLTAERRKAYEECARIAEEAVKGYATTYRGVGLDIANEIRRRMEGV